MIPAQKSVGQTERSLMLERGPDVLEPRCLRASVAAYLQTSSSHKVQQQAVVSFCIHFSRGWPTSSHLKKQGNKLIFLLNWCLAASLTSCFPPGVFHNQCAGENTIGCACCVFAVFADRCVRCVYVNTAVARGRSCPGVLAANSHEETASTWEQVAPLKMATPPLSLSSSQHLMRKLPSHGTCVSGRSGCPAIAPSLIHSAPQ